MLVSQEELNQVIDQVVNIAELGRQTCAIVEELVRKNELLTARVKALEDWQRGDNSARPSV